jgi:hypothetical protein
MTMAEIVFLLCAATCIACAAMLARAYMKSRSRLLLWSSICFLGFAANNVLLLLDLWVVPAIDLSLWRSAAALAGVSVLVFGLVWDAA